MALSVRRMSGCVTTWWAIAGKLPHEVEETLGFSLMSLRRGYRIFRLAEMVSPNDFEWKDTTAYSGGWSYDATIDEWVQRQDEHRWTTVVRNPSDIGKAEAEFDGFMKVEQQKLNVRTGWAQIVKVIPKAKPTGYPDSEAWRIPQWSINPRRPKAFTLLFDVAGGERCPTKLPTG